MIGQARLSSVFTWKGSWFLDLGASRRQNVDEPRRKVPSHMYSCHIRQRFLEARKSALEMTTSRHHAGFARVISSSRMTVLKNDSLRLRIVEWVDMPYIEHGLIYTV